MTTTLLLFAFKTMMVSEQFYSYFFLLMYGTVSFIHTVVEMGLTIFQSLITENNETIDIQIFKDGITDLVLEINLTVVHNTTGIYMYMYTIIDTA